MSDTETTTARKTETADADRRSIVEDALAMGDIQINGSRPWDIQIHDERFYKSILAEDALGLGESYMEGWWEAEELDAFFFHLLGIDLSEIRMSWQKKWTLLKDRFLNRQSTARAFLIGEHHYDRGNDLFRVMLDRRVTYSCGYWKDATTLDEAQEAKLDLVCRKIGLQPGQKVLDIGCGWGSFMKYAAENYGVSAVGVTVSEEQAALGRELCEGLPVEIRLQDYRDVTDQFDHVVSIGMFEHVGPKNYRTFFEKVDQCLKENGVLLLHTIGNRFSVRSTDPFTEKYIFPNSVIPSIRQIGDATEHLFVMEDWHNFGQDYDPTLMAWNENFEAGWEELRPHYGDTFYRMWRYFLLSGAGSFRVRKMQLWQIVFSKSSIIGGYTPIR
ncbi:MAG: cyclopropane fatty acyl phospholipid synthase [Bacteroidetes bacterium]|nr:cyclopropane fatty acyl phospholipid synthase [Bacteroidota bacterium]